MTTGAVPSARFERWAAGTLAVLTATAFAIAVATPPRTGPYCRTSCLGYPYADVAGYFPRDYLWMYPALLVPLAFVVLVGAVHHRAAPGRRAVGTAALSLAVLSAGVLVVNYFVQLTVVPPSVVRGERDGIALLTQYNPHGLFIALEDLGYLLMAGAFLFLAPVLTGRGAERATRWLLVVGGAVAVVSFVAMSAWYGNNLEYRAEVVIISAVWTVLITSGILLAVASTRRPTHARTVDPPGA